jgi:hypothetical protein
MTELVKALDEWITRQGFLPDAWKHAPTVAIVHERDPDSPCDLEVYVNDERIADITVEDVDPGRGADYDDWQARIEGYLDDSTQFGRAAHDALVRNADSEHIR